jgi:hypothetical protein
MSSKLQQYAGVVTSIALSVHIHVVQHHASARTPALLLSVHDLCQLVNTLQALLLNIIILSCINMQLLDTQQLFCIEAREEPSLKEGALTAYQMQRSPSVLPAPVLAQCVSHQQPC